MSPKDFENQLRRLDRIGTLVRSGRDRQTWRFEFNDRPHYLHFYKRAAKHGGRAAKEFAALKSLQDLKVPAVRTIALLAGFTLAGNKGDAIITLGVEPAVRLSEAVTPDSHRSLLLKLIEWLLRLRAAGLGHENLRAESFLLAGNELLLASAADVTQSGLSRRQLSTFAHNAWPWLTRADRVRVWRAIAGDEDLPAARQELFARDLRGLDILPFDGGEWKGLFQRSGRSVVWSIASRLSIDTADWQREWPRLLALLRADQLDIVKRDRSGDILAGTIALGGRPIDVIVKRPRNKFWYRSALGIFRRSRGLRLWRKTLQLQVRHVAVEVPLLVMERRIPNLPLGRVVDSLVIFERVPGPTLAQADLDAVGAPPLAAGAAAPRERFFRRCGRLLRRIEDTGLTHTDAKSSNWIVFDDPAAGPSPVLVDAYGIRRLTSFLQLFGIRRLLRAMKQHPQYTPADSLAICVGFSPSSAPLAEAEHAN